MNNSSAAIQTTAGGVVIEVLASAGASVSKVRGLHGSALKVAVRAPPERGKANAEIEELLAEFFGVSKSQVAVIGGVTSRNKRVEVRGIDIQTAQRKLAQT